MSNNNLYEFTQVYSKRKPKNFKGSNKVNLISPNSCDQAKIDSSLVLKRIQDCKTELPSTDFHDSVSASLHEAIGLLNNPVISEIICIGLGKFSECVTSRYQLALLLSFKETFKVDVYASDPLFSSTEKSILNQLGIKVIERNFEGKYKLKSRETTIFYLPHCPKQLTNNLLWANWGLDLSCCIIIANSFNDIFESCTKRELQESCSYIFKIFPYVTEVGIVNSFKYYEIFNNTAVHIFPIDKLSLITSDFWQSCAEPTYKEVDLEFHRNRDN